MIKDSVNELKMNRNVDGVIRYINEHHDLEPDEIILAISIHQEGRMHTTYYQHEQKKVKQIWLTLDELNQWILQGRNRKIVQWLLEGEIVDDPSGEIHRYIENLHMFPSDLRKKRMLVEFSQFVRRYVDSSNLLRKGDTFDSYSNILRALHHWARIKIIEDGKHPEVTVWSQVKKIDPEVYKMYGELISGEETLEKKIELVLLASEFSILSELKESGAILLELLKSNPEPWTYEQLCNDPSVAQLPVDFDVLIAKMIGRSLVREVPIPTDEGLEIGFKAN